MVSPQCVFSIELYGYYYVRNISYIGYIDMVSHQSVSSYELKVDYSVRKPYYKHSYMFLRSLFCEKDLVY